MLTAIAILGILASLALPAFSDLIKNNRRTVTVNELTAGLMLARAEATRSGRPVVICGVDDANANHVLETTEQTCSGVDWRDGWMVASWGDADSDGVLDSGDARPARHFLHSLRVRAAPRHASPLHAFRIPCRRGRSMTRTTTWIAALFACAAAVACGNNAGLDFQTFTVSLATAPQTTRLNDGTLVTVIELVVDTDGGHVIGASLKYLVSTGDLSPATGVSGANGLASVTWTVTPAQAAGQTQLRFAACADNQDPSLCTPEPLATLNLPAAP